MVERGSGRIESQTRYAGRNRCRFVVKERHVVEAFRQGAPPCGIEYVIIIIGILNKSICLGESNK